MFPGLETFMYGGTPLASIISLSLSELLYSASLGSCTLRSKLVSGSSAHRTNSSGSLNPGGHSNNLGSFKSLCPGPPLESTIWSR